MDSDIVNSKLDFLNQIMENELTRKLNLIKFVSLNIYSLVLNSIYFLLI